jgi:hypothetical protein
MIKTIKSYRVICDGCGIEVDGYSWELDLLDLLDLAFIDNWIEHEDGNYCPDCYELDDNDNIIIQIEGETNE